MTRDVAEFETMGAAGASDCQGKKTNRANVVVSSHESRRAKAVKKLNSGDTSGAVSLIRELLSEDADNPDLLGLLGVALEEAGDIEAAADALGRALALPADSSIELRNASNFAALLFATRRRQEAIELLRKGWRWPADKTLQSWERNCVKLLAKFMTISELWDETADLLSPVVKSSQHDWEILRYFTLALAGLGRTDEALRLAEGDRLPDTVEFERQALLAFIHLRAGRIESRGEARSAYLKGAPPFRLPARRGQKFTIGVIDPAPTTDRLIKPAGMQHFIGNTPSTVAPMLAHRYRFASILLGSGPEAVETFRGYDPRVVINNVVTAEFLLSVDSLSKTRALIDAIGAPLINAPEPAAECTRQLTSTRLADIPNMVVPGVFRYFRDVKRLDEVVTAIEEDSAYPVILRTTGEQESANMALVHTRTELLEVLLRLQSEQIYMIEYEGTPQRDGFYRRIRAAFVDGTPIIIRADYDQQWIVKSRGASPFEHYREQPDLLADANDIVSRPHDRLGAPAMEALEAVARSIPLEIFGMDFDVDDEGRVVLFEANASMNVGRIMGPTEFAYPPEAMSRFISHIERLIQRKART
jgi:tetratricopeptide (TPR) repeat protein/glutathione synthase/RimK-type ligase-like ATP-grasp enzyme